MAPMSEKPAFRLPTSATPARYDLHLNVDPERSTFQGSAKITLRLHEPVGEIVLHGRDFEIEEADFYQKGEQVDAEVTAEVENEALRFRPAHGLDEGEAVLEIFYTGKVQSAMQGLYLAQDGEERCLVTQCEATDARAVFPCFDEPAFKAEIAWQITAPAGLTVLSNGPLEERSEDEGGKTETWRFAPTPPVSSYLAAFAVGAFAATKERLERGVPHKVWALGGKERFGEHARDFAARCQAWYEDYFDVKYRFAAYDQLAVPSFAFGAMENPGLVVFRPSLLLLDPKEASWREGKQVDRVVAHEAAHMWFGNHVTMQWWDDLWLNEAFAEWVAHKCLDDLEPSHDIWLMFQGAADRAMATDALAATHPIHIDVATPEEAQEIFDAITYGKGSAVMRMIEDFLGPEDFRAGLRDYMARFGGKNARGADLWEALAKASGKPVDEIMRAWVSRPGHPLVRARLDGEGKESRLMLHQERAYVLPDAGSGEDAPWPVPLVVRFKDEGGVQEVRHLLDSKEGELALPVKGALDWCVVNARDSGFYRVVTDDSLAERLKAGYMELDPGERRGVLRDLWFLTKRGEVEPARFLELLDKALAEEDHYAVTQDLVGTIRGLERVLELGGQSDALGKLRSWVGKRLKSVWAELGAQSSLQEAADDPKAVERRAAVFSAMGGTVMAGDAVEQAVQIAALEREDPQQVEAETAQTAVRLAVMQGGPDHFDLHVDTFKKRRAAGLSPQLVERYLYTLPAARDEALVERVIALCHEGTVPNQGVGPILRIMLVEPHSQQAAWDYVKGNWEKLRGSIGDAWCPILVEHFGFLAPALHEEARAFMEGLGTYAGESRKRAEEMMRVASHTQKEVLPGIIAWLEKKTPA